MFSHIYTQTRSATYLFLTKFLKQWIEWSQIDVQAECLHSRNGIRSRSVVSSASPCHGFICTQFSGWRLLSRAWPLMYMTLEGSLFSLERSYRKTTLERYIWYGTIGWQECNLNQYKQKKTKDATLQDLIDLVTSEKIKFITQFSLWKWRLPAIFWTC